MIQEQFEGQRNSERTAAAEAILKLQEENQRNYNRGRKEPNQYQKGDLVAIQKTQFETGAKVKANLLGPYRVIKTIGPARYEVERTGAGSGPRKTSTAADLMKPWVGLENISSDEVDGDDDRDEGDVLHEDSDTETFEGFDTEDI